MIRRSHRLLLVCMAAATALTLAGCQRGPQAPGADPGSGQQPPTANHSSRHQPATGAVGSNSSRSTPPQRQHATAAATATATSRGTDFGFIRSWYVKRDTIYLRFDRAIMLWGKAADAASAAHGGRHPWRTTTTSRTTTHACATW